MSTLERFDRTGGANVARWEDDAPFYGADDLAEDRTNVGQAERIASVAAGALLATVGLSRQSGPGWLIAAVGGAMVYRGLSGHCPAYEAIGVNTADADGYDDDDIAGPAGGAMTMRVERARQRVEQRVERRGVHIEQALLINRPAAELYAYWRDFTNLPRIMSYLQAVRVGENGRSHWVAKAPRLAGGEVSWEAEMVADEPDRRIAWRSLPGSDIDTTGEIRFSKAMGDRGTEVHVTMKYLPPGGRIGHWLTSMLGENPDRVVREDLRNFKRTMEIGEVLTIAGQPRGTCKGEGKREPESDWRPLYK